MGFFSNMMEGSAYFLRWLQKCIQTVLVVQNLNPLLETQSCTLFTHSCIRLSACGRDFARIHRAKSSTKNEAHKPLKTDFTILLILRLKRTGDKMLPWGTLISCSYVSDRVDPALTWNRWCYDFGITTEKSCFDVIIYVKQVNTSKWRADLVSTQSITVWKTGRYNLGKTVYNRQVTSIFRVAAKSKLRGMFAADKKLAGNLTGLT